MADEEDLSAVVGHNLRLLRSRRGYSLERLAQISGVSRAMLGQIELGRSAPTINLLWKVARALEIPLSAPHRRTAQPWSRGIKSSRLESPDLEFAGVYVAGVVPFR